jgi:energy-converting hydrogenase A subunit R
LNKKTFITDCEGPISLNDNAYELCAEFIPDGDEFFKKVSAFDDYLVEEVHKENYNAGDTLKLIVPFLIAYGLNNEKMIEFSKNNISLVNGAKETMEFAKINLSSYIVSTSYCQYIEALTDYIDFPFLKTSYTLLDIDTHLNNDLDINNSNSNNSNSNSNNSNSNNSNSNNSNSNNNINDEKESEIKTLIAFKDEILKADFDRLEEIFFKELPKLKIAKIMEKIITVGGVRKKFAVDTILEIDSNTPNRAMYVGDSITDVEPLRFIKENGGLAVSFNGNRHALKEADIAVISDNTIVTSILIDLFNRYNKNYAIEFAKSYTIDPVWPFENLRLNFPLINKFREVFKDKENPIIAIVNDDNFDYVLEKSHDMRNKIRGKAKGGLV